EMCGWVQQVACLEGYGPLVAGSAKRGSGGTLDVGQVSLGLPQEGVDGGVGAPHVVRSGGVEARAFTQSPLQADDVREGRAVQLRAGLDTGEIEVLEQGRLLKPEHLELECVPTGGRLEVEQLGRIHRE